MTLYALSDSLNSYTILSIAYRQLIVLNIDSQSHYELTV